jgi:hypothetical protein
VEPGEPWAVDLRNDFEDEDEPPRIEGYGTSRSRWLPSALCWSPARNAENSIHYDSSLLTLVAIAINIRCRTRLAGYPNILMKVSNEQAAANRERILNEVSLANR